MHTLKSHLLVSLTPSGLICFISPDQAQLYDRQSAAEAPF